MTTRLTTPTRLTPGARPDTDHGDDWRVRAECRDEDPRLFHPEEGEAHRDWQVRRRVALAICAPCPVKGQCLAGALKHLDDYVSGVWGGTTEEQRAEQHPPPMPRSGRRRARLT